MAKPTLYLETSVPSYLLAAPSRDVVSLARQEITRQWWRRDQTRFDVVVSDVVVSEASLGDAKAAGDRIEFISAFRLLETTANVERLAQVYVEQSVVPETSPGDAAHLAFATCYSVDFLCTWNFRHIANAFGLQRLRRVNEHLGLETPIVSTPEELLGE